MRTSVTTDGYTFTIHHMPKLKVANADYLNVSVTDPGGKPATFTPWFGALAHAVFFRQGNLAYFHTHICSPNLPLCAANSADRRIIHQARAAQDRDGVPAGGQVAAVPAGPDR